MLVRYGGPRHMHSYTCSTIATNYGGEYCQYLPGEAIDAFVSGWVLRALEPAALTLSLEATARLEQERQALDQLWRQRLERAAYESERAARHYRLVEPEHRLVARQLAKEWEEKLTAQRQLQEDYHRFLQTQPQLLGRAEREAIEKLAQNIPSLWHAPTTTVADRGRGVGTVAISEQTLTSDNRVFEDLAESGKVGGEKRKEIVRQLIQRIIVMGEGLSERVQMTIEWAGGGTTAGITTRPISRIEHLSFYPQLCDRLRSLAQAGLGSGQITSCLAEEGFESPKYARPFSRQSVVEIMKRLGLHQTLRRQRPILKAHEWWLSDLQSELGCSNSTLHLWRKRGWMQARRYENGRRWVAWADEAELQRLKQRCAVAAGDKIRDMWLDDQYAQTTPSLQSTTLSSYERK